MATVTKTTTAVIEGNIYSAGICHWSDIGDMDTCGVGAGNISGPVPGWLYTPICTDFGFALTSTDIITKIEVYITGQQDGTSYLDYCSLMHNGVPTPVHCFQSDAVNPLDATSHTLTFQPISSGDPDLWGLAWSSAIVNDSTFGVAFDGYHNRGDSINIDCVQIKITYTPGGTPVPNTCDGIPCDEFMDLADAIKSIIAKFEIGEGHPFECIGFKTTPALKKCEDLTDLTECGVKYTFEQALKSALTNDGCGNWALRIWVLPPEDWGGPQ
jgi:hypothetical protein